MFIKKLLCCCLCVLASNSSMNLLNTDIIEKGQELSDESYSSSDYKTTSTEDEEEYLRRERLESFKYDYLNELKEEEVESPKDKDEELSGKHLLELLRDLAKDETIFALEHELYKDIAKDLLNPTIKDLHNLKDSDLLDYAKDLRLFKNHYYHTNSLGNILKDEKEGIAQEYFFQDDVWKNYEIYFVDGSLSLKDYQYNRKKGVFKNNYGYKLAKKFRKIRKELDNFDLIFMNKWNEGFGLFFSMCVNDRFGQNDLYGRDVHLSKNDFFSQNDLRRDSDVKGYEEFKFWEFCNCDINNPPCGENQISILRREESKCGCFKSPREKILINETSLCWDRFLMQDVCPLTIFFTYDNGNERARIEYIQENDDMFLVLIYTVKEGDFEKTLYFKRFADSFVDHSRYNNRIQILKRKISS